MSIKRVSRTTVCIYSKSRLEKASLRWSRFPRLRKSEYEAGCFLLPRSLVRLFGRRVDLSAHHSAPHVQEEAGRGPGTSASCEREPAGSFFYTHFRKCFILLHVLVTKFFFGLLLTAQWEDAEYSAAVFQGKTTFTRMLTPWSLTPNIWVCLVIVDILPPTEDANSHVPAIVGVDHTVWEKKGVGFRLYIYIYINTYNLITSLLQSALK